ncbi:hypothetical protein B566_EDAN002908 [Ephemera danica]|nr:hypothetical protein B566_EDAN002908 [Ephemera danica]
MCLSAEIPHPSTTNRSPVTTMEPPDKELRRQKPGKKERVETNEIMDDSQQSMMRERDMKLRGRPGERSGTSLLPTSGGGGELSRAGHHDKPSGALLTLIVLLISTLTWV